MNNSLGLPSLNFIRVLGLGGREPFFPLNSMSSDTKSVVISGAAAESYLTGTNVTIGAITYPSSYQDAVKRINGTRTYSNTRILRSPDLGSGTISSQQLPPLTTDTYYTAGVGVAGPEGSTLIGGNGKVVLIF